MKKLLALLIIMTFICTVGSGTLSLSSAGASNEKIITVLLSGKKIEFDVAPVVENGRTLVPLRAIFEALDMEVNYDVGAITAKKEGLTINLTIDSSIAYINGEENTLDVPSRIVNGRTIVPLRFIGESTGLTVGYDGATKTVTMNDLPNAILTPKNHDLKSDWDNNTVTKITLNGSSALVEGSGAAANGGVITISKAGTYVVSGTLTNGQIIVNATNEDRVCLILNGTNITNRTGAAIYAPQCDKLILTLADGTENTVTDGGSDYIYTLVDDKEPNAAIFAKDDLTINGTGKLTVNAGFNNGIGTKDDLLIISGNFIVNAANNGVRGNDSVGIINGTFKITAGNDGIQTSNDTNENKGFIIIEDGSFSITAKNDGIQAENSLTITGGIFQIITGGGSANAPVREGGFGRDFNNGERQPRPQIPVTTTVDESSSMKAIKAQKQINITGGVFNIDAEDDGIHSNYSIFISGGKLNIKTGDDGIHADSAVVISGGITDIPVCYEGIEGLTVTISGGNISVVASDDGINASAGDNDEQIEQLRSMTEGSPERGGRQPGRQPGGQQGVPQDGQGMPSNGNEPKFAITEGAFVLITGGTIDLWGGTDGIDSNGHLYIEGGTVKISGQSMGAEGALDMDGDFVINGGDLITAGSIYPTTGGSTQPIIRVSCTNQNASGTAITIKNSNGNTLLE